MKRSRLLFFMLSLLMVLSLATSAVGAAVPEDKETVPPPPVVAVSMGVNPDAALPGGGVQSLAGSNVTFAPGAGGQPCYDPHVSQTLCFQSDSYSPDYEYVYNNWLKFPDTWEVTNVYVAGTPTCDNGSWGDFSWSFQTAPYEVNIAQTRYQGSGGAHCVATYCVDVIPAGTADPTGVSWYFDGDGYGSIPHNPCSSDIYTPAGQTACDEWVNPQALVPICELQPGIYLEPETLYAEGCGGEEQVHTFTVSNTTGYDTLVDFDYVLADFTGTFSGPAELVVANGASVTFDVFLEPHACLEDGRVIHAALDAEDLTYGYTDSSTIVKTITGGVNEWTQIATNPVVAMDNVLAAYNGMVWSITGYGSTGVSTYDPVADTWATIGSSAPPFANYARSGCQVGNKVYIYGDANGGYTGLWSYDMDTNTWAQETPAGTPPEQAGIWAPAWVADEANGICYMTGGATAPGGGNLTTVYAYDAVANAWLAPLPNFTSPRAFHAAFFFNRPADGHDLLCVAGGVNSDSVVWDSTQCYDFTTAAWNGENTDLGAVPFGWWGMGYAQRSGDAGEELWLVNGADPAFAIANASWYYDVASGTWYEYGPLESGAVYRTAAVTLDETVYHVGGSTGGFTPSGLADKSHTLCPECSMADLVATPEFMNQVQRTDDIRSQLATVCNEGDQPLVYDILEGNVMSTIAAMGHGKWFQGTASSTLALVNGGGMRPTSTSGYRWVPDSPSIQGLEILVYADDFMHTAPNTYLDQALQSMGLPYTAFYDGAYYDFTDYLLSGSWDLVLVAADNYGVTEETLDALRAYVAGGGRLVFGNWYVSAYASHELYGDLGFTYIQNDTQPPNPVNWWVADHPLFNIPNVVPEFTIDDVGDYIYGQEVEPLAGYAALAGATDAPTPNLASLIIGNDNRTIFRGFLDFANNQDEDTDGVPDGVELWQNIIHMYYDVPWLSVVPGGNELEPGECASHDVIFDSHGIPVDSHLFAELYFYSNDPLEPVVTLPVSLHVLASGDIETDPSALSAEVAPNDSQSGEFTIYNNGDAPLHWRLLESFVTGPLAVQGQARGEWLYRAVEGVPMQSNAGTSLAYPSAYRWTPAVQPQGGGISILVYADDPYHAAPNTYLDQAIRYLGLPYTAYYDGYWGGFMDALVNGGPWDLVLFGHDNYSAPEEIFTALNDYVTGGGKLILNSWLVESYSTNPLWATMGITNAVSYYDPPQPVYWWMPEHPNFIHFDTVPEFTDLEEMRYGTYGQRVEPLSGYVALAGYTATAAPNEAGIVVRGSDGGTIFKAFLDGHNDADLDADAMPDGAELWSNMIRGILEIDHEDMPWFNLTGPVEGAIPPGGSQTLIYHFHPNGIPAGEYFGWLAIYNTALNESVYDVPVSLTVLNAIHLPVILK
ncbi:MAG TPA: kelch repeat-containing protein [Anaerolineaceae bacterium]|nr:kelch repeat-containing protein [Anaerolineaceae bacterium]